MGFLSGSEAFFADHQVDRPNTFKIYNPKMHYYFRRVDDEVVLCNLVSRHLFTSSYDHLFDVTKDKLELSNNDQTNNYSDDVDTLFELINRNLTFLQEFIPTISLAGNNKQSVNNFIDSCNQRFKHSTPQYVMLTVAIWYKNEMAGLVGIQNFNAANFNCEVGYWIGQEFQSKGIAIRAVRQFCRDQLFCSQNYFQSRCRECEEL
ncbi:hypothetical protein FDP41_004255 [Naegleria fowleri]|uniref:N-acetyltransferase domain-containing protein n=1 Tax=Naegleria fowleri TaxID=5763 RepID=A0A6A5BT59_NAEFO|nr:uncharacterized protein FDP41_004255 [Naegleria fowleri]KAF0976960.1 hypothetical protein FDP41_004255 [Naegleria fowleri]